MKIALLSFLLKHPREKRKHFWKISEEATSEESQIGSMKRDSFWVTQNNKFSNYVSSSGFVSQSPVSRSTSQEIGTFLNFELCTFIAKSVSLMDKGLTVRESRIPHKKMRHVLWDHRCSWLWDFRNRYEWRCFPGEMHLWACTEPSTGSSPHCLIVSEEGTVQMANISLQGHPSLLMQGFLWVWEFMIVCLCFCQLCDSGCSKQAQQKIMAPRSGLVRSAGWV